jgi:hypothetical protein
MRREHATPPHALLGYGRIMPTCYLIALCRSSALDRDRDNFSLFEMVEQISVSPYTPGEVLPIETHAYWELAPEELGVQFEARVAWVGESGAEPSAHGFTLTPSSRRFRVRALHLQLPTTPGPYHLHVEWRAGTTETWTRTQAFWPVDVVTLPVTAAAEVAPGTQES